MEQVASSGPVPNCLKGTGPPIRETGNRETMNRKQREEITETMGEWLGTLAPWDVFGTWTFARIVSAPGAMICAKKYFKWVEKVAEQPIYGFYAAERGGNGGLIHLHGLLGNVKHLAIYCGTRLPTGVFGKKCCMVHSWHHGIARVLPYNPALGANHYVSKYIVKDLAEWDLHGSFKNPQSAFGHKGAEFTGHN